MGDRCEAWNKNCSEIYWGNRRAGVFLNLGGHFERGTGRQCERKPFGGCGCVTVGLRAREQEGDANKGKVGRCEQGTGWGIKLVQSGGWIIKQNGVLKHAHIWRRVADLLK